MASANRRTSATSISARNLWQDNPMKYDQAGALISGQLQRTLYRFCMITLSEEHVKITSINQHYISYSIVILLIVPRSMYFFFRRRLFTTKVIYTTKVELN